MMATTSSTSEFVPNCSQSPVLPPHLRSNPCAALAPRRSPPRSAPPPLRSALLNPPPPPPATRLPCLSAPSRPVFNSIEDVLNFHCPIKDHWTDWDSIGPQAVSTVIEKVSFEMTDSHLPQQLFNQNNICAKRLHMSFLCFK